MTPEEIKTLRAHLCLTQEAFAARIGTKLDTLRSWEHGHRNPSGPAVRLMELIRDGRVLPPREGD